MNSFTKSLKSLEWAYYTFRFIQTNFVLIFSLGLIAAFGRAIQLQAFGPISSLGHTLLEILIESTRIAVFFYALGLANFKSGFIKILRVIKHREARRQSWRVALMKVRQQWIVILINLVVFLLIAYLFNQLIDHIAYETCLYITLRAHQFMSDQSSEWALILFFKNISVIPFTLVFEALFLVWITNGFAGRHNLTISREY